jgi:hypothetical protein
LPHTAELDLHPLGTSLDELIEQQANIRKCESADIEAEEFGRVAGTEFEANVRG